MIGRLTDRARGKKMPYFRAGDEAGGRRNWLKLGEIFKSQSISYRSRPSARLIAPLLSERLAASTRTVVGHFQRETAAPGRGRRGRRVRGTAPGRLRLMSPLHRPREIGLVEVVAHQAE